MISPRGTHVGRAVKAPRGHHIAARFSASGCDIAKQCWRGTRRAMADEDAQTTTAIALLPKRNHCREVGARRSDPERARAGLEVSALPRNSTGLADPPNASPLDTRRASLHGARSPGGTSTTLGEAGSAQRPTAASTARWATHAQSAVSDSNTNARFFCSVVWHSSAATVTLLVQVSLPLETRIT